MQRTIAQSVMDNFLGNAASWYKLTIIGFLVLNPIVLMTMGPFIAGWLLVGEFIFCLAMALKCYPLQPGGLLAVEAIVLGLATYGYRVMETVGKKITELTPSRGFAAEFGAATTIVLASKLGLPVSTTHTLVGAVIGVGFARGSPL